ncbi:MAG: DNA polymerase IV [Candidatus Schekmanbacteria bacterium]|nr:DNA polymerase IV [Candidatus Schekmanbacteria bacterium]
MWTAQPEAHSDVPQRRILHCDMDCYYAAVHMRDRPDLRGRPVVVGGSPASRAVVCSASYEARAHGVRSAMPCAQALRRCPQAVFLAPDFPRYKQESALIFAIYRTFTPIVETVSLDEAYLDVTNHLAAHGSASAVAAAIKQRVKSERGLTVSVGVGPSPLVAKIASDYGKPDGLTIVPPARVASFLSPLPVRRLPGIGPATERRLRDLGLDRIGELAAAAPELLFARLGRYGLVLKELAAGVDDRALTTHWEVKSLSAETTFDRDLRDPRRLRAELAELCHEVCRRLTANRVRACGVTVKIRYGDFETITRSCTFASPTRLPARLIWATADLLRGTEAGARPVRLLGVGAQRLSRSGIAQRELFAEAFRMAGGSPSPGAPDGVVAATADLTSALDLPQTVDAQ